MAPSFAPPVRITYNVLVRDVMSRAPVTIRPRATLWEALVLMRTHIVTGLPVVDGDARLVGVLSQKDVAAFLSCQPGAASPDRLLSLLTAGPAGSEPTLMEQLRQPLEETMVEEAMSQPPIFVRSDAPLELAMETMIGHSINRLPVVDSFRLVGIVTPGDVLRATLRAGHGAR